MASHRHRQWNLFSKGKSEDLTRYCYLELDLKKLEIDIKTEKTNAKKIGNLEAKIKAQRTIKDMEKKRNEMRKRLFEAQDEVETRKEQLIDRVETQLKQKSRLEPLFTVRWQVK